MAARVCRLTDKAKLSLAEATCGTVANRCVLYRGPATTDDEVSYANVEEYLRGLDERGCCCL